MSSWQESLRSPLNRWSQHLSWIIACPRWICRSLDWAAVSLRNQRFQQLWSTLQTRVKRRKNQKWALGLEVALWSQLIPNPYLEDRLIWTWTQNLLFVKPHRLRSPQHKEVFLTKYPTVKGLRCLEMLKSSKNRLSQSLKSFGESPLTKCKPILTKSRKKRLQIASLKTLISQKSRFLHRNLLL